MGFPVGPSSGLNFVAALEVARKNNWSRIVTVFPDRMERYFTTELFKPFREEETWSPIPEHGWEMKRRAPSRWDENEWM
jgi:hypothetical protein